MKKRAGAPPDPRIRMYAEKFGLSLGKSRKMFEVRPVKLLNQLDACASDMHRRLILGIKAK
jgi:hypothetical protein